MVNVSVVVPVYNVKRYLRECLDSIVNQTLKDIEIICVDDGSTDGSEVILDEYAKKDNRVKVIHKKNTGYGNSMNIGFDAATGEYVGIVESDDYAESDMFEKLYNIAHANNLDVIKSSFYFYYTEPTVRNESYYVTSKVMEGVTFCPSTYFEAKAEMVEFYNIKPSIWSAIYKNDFIKKNKIRFLETLGASYQDAGFSFKVMALAERVQLTRMRFVHYRQDSVGSSINSKGKVFCVCDEYDEMKRFLDEHPIHKARLEFVLYRIMCDSFMWNYNRVSRKYKFLFAERASVELKEALDNGKLDRDYFDDFRWKWVNELAEDPVDFHTNFSLGESGSHWKSEYERVTHSLTYKIGNCITIGPRVARKFIRCIFKHGLVYTFTVSLKEFMHS